MNSEIVIVSNDVAPGMGTPVAAPGLRAWGLAQGLREHGLPVTLVVDARVARLAWKGDCGIPRPEGTLLMGANQIGDFVRTVNPRAVILTNSNHFDALGDTGSVPLIYDFFAPKVLELMQHAPSPARERALASLTAQKLRALSRVHGVVINGWKKQSYVDSWLTDAGRVADAVPKACVPTPISPYARTTDCDSGKLRALVSGYIQPWSQPGAWIQALVPLLHDESIELHLLMAQHWGAGDHAADRPSTLDEISCLPGVYTHGLQEFNDFQKLTSECDVAIDVFERNPERELAMVTRTLVSLACGVPVIHVPFTESALIIKEYDAGWLVDGSAPEGTAAALRSVLARGSELHHKRRAARKVSTQVLAPRVAVGPLVTLIESTV